MFDEPQISYCASLVGRMLLYVEGEACEPHNNNLYFRD